MNKALFSSMQEQMAPSPQAVDGLKERLEQTPRKKRPSPWTYGALAACAVLVIAAYPLYRHFAPADRLHSYVTAPAGSAADMSQAENSPVTGAGDAGVDIPSGALPGGGEADADAREEGMAAYQKLTARLDGSYPAWYGGAYLDNTSTLVVLLVEDQDPGDKSLELQVMDWTDNGRVAFGAARYSLKYLTGLQEQVVDKMLALDLRGGCGVDEENNRLHLTLTDVTDHALSVLAELDPADDAIYVQVGRQAATDVERPVSRDVQPGGAVDELDGDPAGYAPIPEPIAVEPVSGEDDLAHYDILGSPTDTRDVDIPAYDPQA